MPEPTSFRAFTETLRRIYAPAAVREMEWTLKHHRSLGVLCGGKECGRCEELEAQIALLKQEMTRADDR